MKFHNDLRAPIGALLLFGLSACTTSREQARQYVDEALQSVDRLTQSQYDVARAQGADTLLLDSAEERFQGEVIQQRQRLDDLKSQIDAEKQRMDALLGGFGTLALNAVDPTGVAASLVQQFRSLEDRDRELANETERLEAKSDEVLGQVRAVEEETQTSIADLNEEGRETNSKLEELGSDLRDRVLEASRAQTQFEGLTEKLEALDEDLLARLADFRGDLQSGIEDLEADRDQLLGKIEEGAQLSQEQIKQLDGLSTQELLWLLGALGGSVVSGGVLGRSGPSRAQKDVAELRNEVSVMKARADAGK